MALALLGLAAAAVQWGNDAARVLESARPSRSIGTVSNGSLENGKRLPTSGPNFVAYSRLGALLGRNSVHSSVRDVVVDAYGALEGSAPDRLFTYGETGWPNGGPFRPHRSHQNGMSVDFMMPLRSTSSGQPVQFPTSLFEKVGYGLEFDRLGICAGYTIDFEIIARHLVALDEAARQHGLAITKVIVTPEYLPLLWATPTGATLQKKLPFMQKPSWVRHDEHYHVDFAVGTGLPGLRSR
jgi:penicillin-insensitive murein DD-endopeptidase